MDHGRGCGLRGPPRPILYFFIIINILIACLSPSMQGNFFFEDIEQKLAALLKVVDYMNRRPDQMNADATFGITITEANIAAALLHENASHLGHEHLNALNKILKICDSTRRYLITRVVSGNENIQKLHESLNNPALWMRRISWEKGVLEKTSINRRGASPRATFDLIMQGRPQAAESDRCLVEIVGGKFGSTECRLPKYCNELLNGDDRARGYPLTHRLLIVKVVEAFENQCEEQGRFSDLIIRYCSAVLQDLIDIEAAGFPYNTRDLTIEQVLLCGMEGFLEFTDKRLEKLILSWAHHSGCFSAFGLAKKEPVVRRTSWKTDFGCDSHATGLAAAALSLFVRKSVENGSD